MICDANHRTECCGPVDGDQERPHDGYIYNVCQRNQSVPTNMAYSHQNANVMSFSSIARERASVRACARAFYVQFWAI